MSLRCMIVWIITFFIYNFQLRNLAILDQKPLVTMEMEIDFILSPVLEAIQAVVLRSVERCPLLIADKD